MMKWGLEIADAKGLITWVESTEDGKGFYEASGFEVVKPLRLDVGVEGMSEGYLEERKKLRLPLLGWILSRPARQMVEDEVDGKHNVEDADMIDGDHKVFL
jgi:hypothetical protein